MFRLHVKIDEFITFGLQQDCFIPKIITSDFSAGETALLEVAFETNPLDKTCGQRVHVTAQPLQIVFDAGTVNKAIDIFKLPPSTTLDQ